MNVPDQSRLRSILAAVWHAGCAGQTAAMHRRIRLINQLAMLGFTVTIPYQLFYPLFDFGETYPAFLLNLLFMGCYAFVPWLNRQGSHVWAVRLAVAASISHVVVLTGMVSAASGAYLFYIPVACLLLLQMPSSTLSSSITWLLALALLGTACHFLLPSHMAPVLMPLPVLNAMYGMSVGLAVIGTGIAAMMFRLDIENAEREQAAVRAELEHLSGVDQLTQLANRRKLDQHLRGEWLRMQRSRLPLSVLMVDIDLFKRFNDRYGHQAGDVCLQKIARILQTIVWRSGDLVARYGGEEFVIILPETGATGARNLAEQARQGIFEAAIKHADSDISDVVTISIGVASAVPGGGSYADLLRRADDALYAAKHAGRNRIHVAAEVADDEPVVSG
jgi:diguanylate cyclase (GGDEF)-like protein